MSRDWFHAVADRITDPVLLLSVSGRVEAYNPAARRALEAPCLQGDLADCTSDPAAFRRYLRLASRSAAPIPGGAVLVGDSNRWRCDASLAILDGERLLVAHLRTGQEAARRFLLLNEQIERLQAEIARRRTLEEEREALLERERQARDDAETANRLKDEFLASVSHELRTPLHAISGWVELLRETPRDPDLLRRGLEVIAQNVGAQSRLTEDLVDVSLIIGGRMKLETQLVDFGEVVRRAAESIRPAAQAKELRLQVTADVGRCLVNGDPSRLLQVVTNLLSNAVKYTQKGGKIQVTLRQIDSHAELTVSDDGSGISPQLLPYVFDRFSRGDSTSTRGSGGLGLGLAIVRHLVELHGGFAMAHSDGPGKGATFTVHLPLPMFQRRGAAEIEEADAEALAVRQKLAGLRVLLVEDHADSRELLVNILQSRGAVVDAVVSSAAAQQAYAANRPDVIVSDLEMPDEDGFTLLRKLRDRERQEGVIQVPAIAVSAHSVGNVRVHALRSGYQSFLAKPLKPVELIALIVSLCEHRGGTRDEHRAEEE